MVKNKLILAVRGGVYGRWPIVASPQAIGSPMIVFRTFIVSYFYRFVFLSFRTFIVLYLCRFGGTCKKIPHATSKYLVCPSKCECSFTRTLIRATYWPYKPQRYLLESVPPQQRDSPETKHTHRVSQGLTEQDTDLGTRVSPLLGPAELSIEAGGAPPPPSRGFGATASFSNYAVQNEQGRSASGIDGVRSGLLMQNQRRASPEAPREEIKSMERSELAKGGR